MMPWLNVGAEPDDIGDKCYGSSDGKLLSGGNGVSGAGCGKYNHPTN